MENTELLEGLLAKSALNDRAAFEKLYAITSPSLFGFAMHMLKNRDLAEEVLQDSYVKIWYNASQYHHERGAPLSWMISIVRYRAIDLIRGQKSNVNLDDVDIDSLNNQIESKSDLSNHEIGRCIDELQANQKKSILMAFYEGYTHQELAKRLSVPLGTMKSWIRRSLEKLKGCLDELL